MLFPGKLNSGRSAIRGDLIPAKSREAATRLCSLGPIKLLLRSFKSYSLLWRTNLRLTHIILSLSPLPLQSLRCSSQWNVLLVSRLLGKLAADEAVKNPQVRSYDFLACNRFNEAENFRIFSCNLPVS